MLEVLALIAADVGRYSFTHTPSSVMIRPAGFYLCEAPESPMGFRLAPIPEDPDPFYGGRSGLVIGA